MTTLRSTSRHIGNESAERDASFDVELSYDEIRYAIAPSTLGLVLIAQSPTGICAVLLGDDRAELIRDLTKRFPDSRLKSDDAGVPTVKAIVELVDSGAQPPNLSLEMRGTDFQLRVWDALRNIPSGSTASYGEIARELGMPNGARAIAGACAANPLAVLVPCHRVTASDGRLSGYRWGVERKRALLERERAS